MRTPCLLLLASLTCGLSVIAACSGKSIDSGAASAGSGDSSGSGGSTAGTSPGGSAGVAGSAPHAGAGGVSSHEPAVHRASAVACDHTRPSDEPNVPDAGFTQCHTNAECTQGENGRCTANGHIGGWNCSYDLCFVDSDCPTASGGEPELCECGIQADNNVCLPGNCRVDADCGNGGFCSPSLGSCGNYSGFEAYHCHTQADECMDDSDCGPNASPSGAYCAFIPAVGHWQCATGQCVG